MDNKLTLKTMLELDGIDPADVKLIRHSLSDDGFKKCYNSGYDYVKEYTSIQKHGFASNAKYWMIFIADEGTKARYLCTYKISGKDPLEEKNKSDGFPVPEMFGKANAEICSQYILEETDILKSYKERLIIEWGKATISWAQNAANNDKEIAAISSPKFPGYDNLILTFGRLSDIVNDPTAFSSYHEALKNIKAVYLITDTSKNCKDNRRLYVGSATGKDGLFGRWADYAKTKHGGNEGLKLHLSENDRSYENFQYSILQAFPMTAKNDDVLSAEYTYMRKLMTKEYGMN